MFSVLADTLEICCLPAFPVALLWKLQNAQEMNKAREKTALILDVVNI